MTDLEALAHRLLEYSTETHRSAQEKADLRVAARELQERQLDHDVAEAAARRFNEGDHVK